MLKKLLIVALILVSGLSPALTAGASVTNQTDSTLAVTAATDWPMAGANPERTSRNMAIVNPGALAPAWSTVIAPHILNKTQVIAANDTLYISTAKGLYGLYANTGAQKWFYPTSMPLGNSPTVYQGVAYVGGFDNQLHAIDALTGVGRWTFMAGAGFDTNPLVLTIGTREMVFAGNRDGYMYAVYADTGTQAWRYKTGGPIHFSAAYQSPNIYFASNDLSGYALNAATGALAWKSVVLPSADGFQSWWPVIAGNSVIFGNSRGYRPGSGPQLGTGNLDDDILPKLDNTGVVLNAQGVRTTFPRYMPNNVTVPANRVAAMTNALNYFEDMPWRRSFYFLNVTTGVEQTFDLDGDGKTDYAPLMNTGTNNGTRYPVMIGPDPNSTAVDEIYSFNNYAANDYTQGVAGWKPGTTFVTTPSGGQTNGDEPIAFAGMGDYISVSQCCDRSARLYNPKTGQNWNLYSYDLATKFPGYGVKATGTTESNAVRVFGNQNGVYGYHGDQNPLIAYTDSAGVTRLYFHRSNAILAFAPNVSGAATNRVLPDPTASNVNPAVSTTTLQQKLVDEVTKVIAAGHLRPGYGTLAAWSLRRTIGDYFTDYFNNPGDTLYALSLAYAALPADQAALKASLKTYLDNEYANYSPCTITHVGYQATAAARENFTLPREVSDAIASGQNNVNDGIVTPQTSSPFWGGKSPFVYYSLWKYVALTGNTSKAASILSSCGDIGSPPAATTMRELPFVQNAWIGGLYGYMRLQELAGQPVNSTRNAEYTALLADRAANFNKDNTWGGPDTNSDKQQLAVARNFLYMTPELGTYLRTNALSKVQTAFNEYNSIAPYWFVTRFEETYSEGIMEHLYDYAAMSSAKAYIFNATREDLARTLDVPAFARGDLFYIQNLVNTLNATVGSAATPTSTPTPAPTATGGAPTATPTRTPTGIPTAQPTATGSETVNPSSISALPSGTRVLLDFNNFNPAVDNQPVQTSCGGVNWSSIVEGSPWAGNSTWNVYIQNGGSIGTIQFPRSVRVTSVRVSSLGSNTFTLTSPGNPDVVLTTSGNSPQTLTTNWVNPVTQLTLRSTSADQIFDDLRFVLADSVSTPTFTSLPTLTRTATAIATATRTPTRTATATRTPTRTATTLATVTKTPLPTNTPTRTPAATATATPLPPTATPLPGTEVINPSNVGSLLPGARVLLNFNDFPSPVDNQSIPVGYSGLVWSSLVEGSPWAGHTTWNFYMTNSGPVGTITFPVPVLMTSILASSIGSNVLTLSSPGNPDVSVTTTGSTPKTLVTNWANPITVLTLRSSTGDQAFDDLRFVLS